MEKNKFRKFKMSTTKIIALGYLAIILLGSVLLMLPISSKSGASTSFIDCLFTATSATCVTGLVVFDTFTYWSLFGQIIILLMIQIGGIGFMTLALFIISFTNKKIGIKERSILQESVSASQVGGIVKMTRFILITTAIFETFGAVLLSTQFIPEFGVAKGLYFSIFHSISAFCNAGFDLMGGFSGEFSSFTAFADNYIVNFTLCLLIICGGLGFFVWADLYNNKFKIRRYSITTKIVLITTCILLITGMFLILIIEFDNTNFKSMSIPAKILSAFFQSTTIRTAGFNTVDLTKLTDATIILMIPFMLIGGSPGSTAGGMKTTSIALIIASITSTLKQKKDLELFKRRISNDRLLNLTALASLFIILPFGASILISAIDNLSVKEALFETASALGTVGLSLGITPGLSDFSHLILATLMYFGRVGCFTVLLSFKNNNKGYVSKYPVDNVTIG